jgi:hypothetical protein
MDHAPLTPHKSPPEPQINPMIFITDAQRSFG